MKSNVQLISKMQLKSKVQLKRSCSKNLKITIEVSKLFAKYSKKLSFTTFIFSKVLGIQPASHIEKWTQKFF